LLSCYISRHPFTVFFNQELFLFQLLSGAYSFSIGTSKFDIGYCLKFQPLVK
jgi:hypothetical protein